LRQKTTEITTGMINVAEYYLAVEIGGTNLRYGVVGEDFHVLDFQKEPTRLLSDAEDKGAYIEKLVSPYLERYGREHFKCITLSLASLMNKERTVNYNSPHIKGLDNIYLTDILTKRLGLPAFMERDVNTALLYEIWHRNMDSRGIIIGIFIGTGLGNAMCIDGKIYIGHSGSACELGHIPVSGFTESCGCGKDGCIELKASGKALRRLAEEQFHCPVTDIFEKHGDREEVLDIVRACAIAAATEITILDPGCVILGGGVIEMKGFPMEYFEQTVRKNLRIPNPRESVVFYRADGAPTAGIIGAAINASARMADEVNPQFRAKCHNGIYV